MASPWVLCELGAVWGLVSNFVPVVAGLTPESLTGPLGVTRVWRLGDIDDVRSALNQLGNHLHGVARRRERPKQVEDDALERLVTFSSNYRPDTEMLPAGALYCLHSSSEEVGDDTIFQDFDVSRRGGGNFNAVQSMWADTFANGRITASVVTEPGGDKYLRVWFKNAARSESEGERAKGWASNITIRPRGPVSNEREPGILKHKALEFFARVPEEERASGDVAELGLCLRMLDRRLTYWVYTALPQGKGPTQLLVAGSWQRYCIDLSPEYYGMYTGDGNRFYPKKDPNGRPVPDFTIVAGMTVVLGSYTAGREEPQEGTGVVDIRDIRLCEPTAR
jgi:hypothetical protein